MRRRSRRSGTTPQGAGRYPDFDVLAPEVVETWDAPTRRAVLARLRPAAELRFFGREEAETARALCDLLLDQHSEPRVPVVELLDARYAEGRLDGYRYAGMPDDRDAWHLLLKGLDDTARRRHGRRRFHQLSPEQQQAICRDFQSGVLEGGPWRQLDVGRAWSLALRTAVAEFYSHPWTWNEIGFGGPAYPRGFMRTGEHGSREPFERPERR